MRKSRHLLAALACVLALGTESIAQEQVRKLEFEAGLGYSLAMTKEEHYGSLSALLELRYNLRHSPWDVGIHYENSVAPLESVDYEALYDTDPGFKPTGPTDEDIHYILPVADYNFHRGERLSYFIGGGLGMSICRIEYNTRGSVSLMPRAGVEFINHSNKIHQKAKTTKLYTKEDEKRNHLIRNRAMPACPTRQSARTCPQRRI